MIDEQYLEELHKFLGYEQFTSAIVSKLGKCDFKELIRIAFWKAEKDGKIMMRPPVESGDAMRDITGI